MNHAEIISKLKAITANARSRERDLSNANGYEGDTFEDGCYLGELAVDAVACEIADLINALESHLADLPAEPIPVSPGQLPLL